jgi:type I restriction enzyme, S subunit
MRQTGTVALPKNWKRAKFGDCAELINGRAYAQDELLESGTPVLRIQNLNGGERWYYSNITLPPEKYCNDGDLLYAWSASFGPYIWSGPRSIFHYHIWRVLPRDCLDKRFAFYMLDFITRELKSVARGIAMLHLTKSGMESWEINLPPLDEQQRIATILDAADALRAKRRTALAQLDTLAQSIFSEMFGGHQTPSRTTRLSELVEEFRYGTSLKSEETGYPTLRIPNVVGGDLDLSDLKTVPVEREELQRLRLQPGDVLFVRTNGNPNYVGRCAVFDPKQLSGTGYADSDWIYASYLIRARPRPEVLHAVYLREYLLSAFGRKQLRDRCKTSAGQFNINTEGLGSIMIPLPELSRQKALIDV